MIGQAVISVPDWDEEYIITFPNGYGRYYCKALFFLILGLRIFFSSIKVGGGKKIKIKITKFFFFYLI